MPCFRAGLTKPPGLFGLGTLILAVLVIGVAASGLALISSSLCAVVGLRVLVGLSAIHLEMVCVMRPIVLGVLVAAILIAILVYAVLDGIDLHGHIVPSVPNMRALTATGTTTLAIRLTAFTCTGLGSIRLPHLDLGRPSPLRHAAHTN
jgi:hypothetical protein